MLGTLHVFAHNVWTTILSSATPNHVKLYNTNGFRTETMYDYYIVMKSMFLVAKLFSHPSIGCVNLTIFLP
jgi:hypothetical protein